MKPGAACDPRAWVCIVRDTQCLLRMRRVLIRRVWISRRKSGEPSADQWARSAAPIARKNYGVTVDNANGKRYQCMSEMLLHMHTENIIYYHI